MPKRFFGSDFDADYFESHMPVKSIGQKDMVSLYTNGSLPAFSGKPFVTGGKIEMTDYFCGMPYKKKSIVWAQVHLGDGPVRLSELDVYARLLSIIK